MNIFALKILACTSMFLDHVKYYVDFENVFTIFIGRLAFPIYTFLITEGFLHTKDLKKYCIRLFVFALISQLPFYIFISQISTGTTFNVFFTLLFGLLAIISYNHFDNILLKLFIPISLMAIAKNLHFDYGAYGVLLVLIFSIFKKNKIAMSISFILLTIIKFGNIFVNPFKIGTLLLFLGTCSALIPILFYNRKTSDLKLNTFFMDFIQCIC